MYGMPKPLGKVLVEGLLYPKRFIGGRMEAASSQDLDSLAPNQGAILDINGKRVAAFKDPAGKVILHSAVCTHLKCIVKWNEQEKTFDCPCHGSRFNADGSLKNGPAQRGLDDIQI